ncbi:prohibitin, partial [Sigmodon hispidus]
MAAKEFESLGKLGLTLAVAGSVVNSALYTVDAWHRVVIFDQFHGVQDIVLVTSQLPRIYTSISADFDEWVLPSITTEILKSVVARFDTGELITRELVPRQ